MNIALRFRSGELIDLYNIKGFFIDVYPVDDMVKPNLRVTTSDDKSNLYDMDTLDSVYTFSNGVKK